MNDPITLQNLVESASGFEREARGLSEAKPQFDPKLTQQWIRGGSSGPDADIIPEDVRKRLHEAGIKVDKLLKEAAVKANEAIKLLDKLDPHHKILDPKNFNKLQHVATDAGILSSFASAESNKYAKKGARWPSSKVGGRR